MLPSSRPSWLVLFCVVLSLRGHIKSYFLGVLFAEVFTIKLGSVPNGADPIPELVLLFSGTGTCFVNWVFLSGGRSLRRSPSG